MNCFLVEKCDFNEATNHHSSDHIYKKSITSSTVPLEDKLAQIELQPIQSISGCTLKEMVQRWERYYPLVEAQEHAKRASLKEQLLEKDKVIQKQHKQLNRKSVCLTLKLANKLKRN
ncbi:hypothetical protein [Pullulanibacillus camelliae]|uniref:hypothetical protein n=1 Tax=Pullulanibacillus camelliae TaxID=1707096 RepID=UPI00166EED16|nr:hypothetical protein [Pullulanibacillus camelliae]